MNIKPYFRSERYGRELKKILSELIQREVDTTAVGLVTVTNVIASRDLKHAKVYVSALSDAVDGENVEQFFKRRKSYIRGLLGREITSKSVPELAFHYDETSEVVDRMERIFSQIHESETSSE